MVCQMILRQVMMSRQIYYFTLYLLCTLCPLLIQCSSSDIAGGSGAETGNAKIAGVIIDSEGSPAAGVEVFLYPVQYNPVVDTPSGYPIIDTTDRCGTYNFKVYGNGYYTLIAKQPTGAEWAIVNNIPVDKDFIDVQNAVLTSTGVIRVAFPAGSGIKPGYLYISGTPIKCMLTSSQISDGFVHIDSVPEGLFSSLIYISSSGDYRAVIAEQVKVISGDTTAIDMCLCTRTGMGYDSQPPEPVITNYYSFSGTTLLRYAWKGANVAFLTKRKDLDPCSMRRLLTVLDSAYRFNEMYLGQTPPIDKHYQGLMSIAEAPYPEAGLFNGSIGVTGIEMGEDQFERCYSLVASENRFPQELFFVLANNFNSYMRQLTHGNNVKYNIAVSRGFSVFMRFVTMEHVGIDAAPFMHLTLGQYRTKIESLMDLYLADTLFRFSNSFAADTLPFSELKAEHLFASLILRLGKLYGDTFLEKLWREVDMRPAATGVQAAIDNLILASCSAAGMNITDLFVSWKFPVSENAKSEAGLLYP